MTQSSKNNSYTAADFERYYAGTMKAAERHALEKAALDDPFLADALEGYRLTPTPVADMQKIRARQQPGEERSRFFLFRSPLFRAAAALILVAGTAWLAYTLTSQKEKTIAKETIQQEAPVTKTETATLPKPVAADSQLTLSRSSGAGKKQNLEYNQPGGMILPSKETYAFRVTDTAHTKYTQQFAKDKKDNVVSDQLAPNQANARLSANNEAGYNNAIVSNRNPSPTDLVLQQSRMKAENVISNDNLRKQVVNNSIKADTASESAAALQGRVAGVTAMAASRPSVAQPDTIKNFDVVLQEQKRDMEEVVVSGYTKKSVAASRRPQVVVDTLEPEEGFVQFDHYIAHNLKRPEELKLKTSGEVQLSFDVNSKGEPVNITVVKSLCNKCDEEAIRLLKEGPKWKKKKNKKGSVTIRF
jgi:hypothetical protein